MEPGIGDLAQGDLLVDGDRIAAIAPDLQVDDAVVVDCRDRLILPGLINAHMHTWQTGLRGLSANWTLLEYFRWMHAGLATRFTPDDLYLATLVGALNQIANGTTTLVDWCHNNPTPDHTDAAIAGLMESGIRAAFLHGSPKPDPKPGQPHFSEIPHPRHEIERLRKGALSGDDQLVTLGMAILGPNFSTLEVLLQDFRLARDFDLVCSMHQTGAEPKAPTGWQELERRDLLGPWTNIVHGCELSDGELARLADRGASFSVTPETEMTQGHGFPITGRLRRLGRAPSLGVDLESLTSGGMFAAARAALMVQRALDNAESRREHGRIPESSTVTTRDALSWITIEGARMLRLDHRIGSLAPGKQADLIVLRLDELNMGPVHDPVSTALLQADRANIESVMVAGRFGKRDGALCFDGIEAKLAALKASGRRIVSEISV
jgi:cytosine/adenosine deaminase-related metal-dependent hydrolase